MKFSLAEVPEDLRVREESEPVELEAIVEGVENRIPVTVYMGRLNDIHVMVVEEQDPVRRLWLPLHYSRPDAAYDDILSIFRREDYRFESGPLQRLTALKIYV